jgi:putative transposase
MEKVIEKHQFIINLLKSIVIDKYYIKKSKGIQLQHSLDHIIEGILFVCKTGIQWKFLLYKNIKGSCIEYHFRKWTKDKLFDILWKKILNIYQLKIPYKTNLKLCNIDTTFIKSINGNDLIGRNPTDRGRNATKLSVISDVIGTPIAYLLESANVSDCKLFAPTIEKMQLKRKCKSMINADKGYSTKKCKQEATNNNFILNAQNKKNFRKALFKTDTKAFKERYVIEAQFSWLKNNKKVRMRYEKKYIYFDAFILISFCFITNTKINNMIT